MMRSKGFTVALLLMLTAGGGLAARTQPQMAVTATIEDATGAPVPHAALAILTAAGTLPDDARLRAIVPASSDGRLTLPAMPPGPYRLVIASQSALATWPDPAVVERFRQRGFPIDLTSALNLRFVVEVGPPPARDVTMTTVSFSRAEIVGGPGGPPPGSPMRPGAGPPTMPRPNGPGIVSGVVRDADGRPLAGVQVQAGRYLGAGGRAGGQLRPINLPVETDAQGRYRLTGLQPATYVIAALGWRFGLATLDRASSRQVPSSTNRTAHAPRCEPPTTRITHAPQAPPTWWSALGNTPTSISTCSANVSSPSAFASSPRKAHRRCAAPSRWCGCALARTPISSANGTSSAEAPALMA